jgi:hypothetical protein
MSKRSSTAILKMVNKSLNFIFLFLLTILATSLTAQLKGQNEYVVPAAEWLDAKGNAINAHGGGVLHFNGIYYWYGEHKIAGKSEAQFADGGIHCYSSVDLVNWNDVGIVLGVDYSAQEGDLIYGCLIERPKVVFNPKTRKFIAYFKFYPKGNGYEIAYVGVAISDSPAGPFVYSHKFLGAGSANGSGDFSMFTDDDGSMYHLAVRKPDKQFVMAKMRDDYLIPETEYKVCKGVESHTEAPAIVKIYSTYHMLGSGSTGWKPNTARYYTSQSINGPWVLNSYPLRGFNMVDSLGVEKTFGGQSSFILKVQGIKPTYVAMFDIWRPDMPITGRYIWLPIKLVKNRFVISWIDKWNMKTLNK